MTMRAGVAHMNDWTTTQEATGIAAGMVALGSACWQVFRWALGKHDNRRELREAKLETWEHNLVAREKDYREQIEGQLAGIKVDMVELQAELHETRGALEVTRHVMLEVTSELHTYAPDSPALARAQKIMRDAFPGYEAEDVRRLIKKLARKDV